MTKKCVRALFVMLAINSRICQSTSFHSESSDGIFRPKTESEFLNFKIQNKFVVALIINQQTLSLDLHQKLLRQIFEVVKHDYALSKSVLGMIGDTSVIPSLNSLYKVDEVINAKIILFIHNQVADFPGIIETIEESDDDYLLADSVALRLSQILTNVQTTRQVISASDENTVAIYFGNKYPNFEYFEQLAYSNIDFKFLYCFDGHLRLKMYRELGLFFDEKRSFDEVVIIRSPRDISSLDPKTSTYSQQYFSTTSLNAFFEFERYPKLRKSIMALENIRKLYQKRQVMLLFVKDPNQPDSHLLEHEFKEAVSVLPRRLIYAITEIDDPDSGPYHGFASQSGSYLIHNGMYLMYAYALHPTMTQLPVPSMNKEGIVDYVFRFYESNKHLWEFYEERDSSQRKTSQFVNEEL